MTARERKTKSRCFHRDTKYITSHNLSDKKDLKKWHNNNNNKRGSKSRHYIKSNNNLKIK